MTHEFSPDEARRWDAWQTATAIGARRGDLIAQMFGLFMLAAVLTVCAVALSR